MMTCELEYVDALNGIASAIASFGITFSLAIGVCLFFYMLTKD